MITMIGPAWHLGRLVGLWDRHPVSVILALQDNVVYLPATMDELVEELKRFGVASRQATRAMTNFAETDFSDALEYATEGCA